MRYGQTGLFPNRSLETNMAAYMTFTRLRHSVALYNACRRCMSSETPGSDASTGEAGLRKAFEVFSKAEQPVIEKVEMSDNTGKVDSFATLLKNSKLMQMGDADGRVVLGRIVEVMGDDLYIDFGGKFYCVCPVPRVRPRYAPNLFDII